MKKIRPCRSGCTSAEIAVSVAATVTVTVAATVTVTVTATVTAAVLLLLPPLSSGLLGNWSW